MREYITVTINYLLLFGIAICAFTVETVFTKEQTTIQKQVKTETSVEQEQEILHEGLLINFN